LGAQFTTATLVGNVLDNTGAAVPDAKTTVRNLATGFTQNTSTDASGAFLFTRLPVGTYELTVEKQGFTSYSQSGITLTVNQVANQSVTLQVGQLTERVTVEANADLVVTRTATGGQLVDERRIVDLPLNGRGAQTLVFLAAGTIDLTSRYCGVGCQGGVYPGAQTAGVNGVGYGQVNYQLDGTDHNDSYINMNLPFPNPDAIQEFNLQSSFFTAEYGNAAAGVVNIVTKSGTNSIHGDAFEFLRNGTLNARNFFAPTHDTLKRNQFGGSIGGPIRKNKVFYFGTYQGTRVRSTPTGSVTFVPTAAERSGDFTGTKQLVDPLTQQPFPNNQIPASRISPAAQYFLKWIPLPNGAGRQLTYQGQPTIQADDQFMTKVDYNLTKHQISGRYFFTNFNQPAVIPTNNLLQTSSQGNQVRVQNVAFNHTYTLSPNLLFNTTFGLNRQRGGSLSSAPFGFPDAGVKIAAPTPPEISLSITGGYSVSTSHIGQFDRGSFTIREVVTKIVGPHEIHIGGEAVRVSNHIVNTFQMAGSFSFTGQLSGDGVADFMVGRAATFRQGGGEFKYLLGTKWGFFAQDNWRATPNLTFNLGVRWDPFLPYYDRDGRVVCWQPGVQSTRYPKAPPGITYGGDNHDGGCPTAGSNAVWGNVAPRIGFAYRLTQNGSTSIRGGVAYFYTPMDTTDYNSFADIAPFAPTFLFNAVSFDDPYGSSGVPNPFPAQYGPKIPGSDVAFTKPVAIRWTFPIDFRIPRITTWNLVLERQIAGNWVARAGYYGNAGNFLQAGTRELNPAIYVPSASTVANTQSRRFYQDFSNIGQIDSGNNSHFHSMQLTAEKRFSRGFTVLANYTLQKQTDSYGWTNPYSRRFNYGISNDDVKHSFKFSNVYQIPNPNWKGVARVLASGWSLNSVATWRGGFPLSVTSGVDNSFSGVGSDRADFLGGKPDLGNSGRAHAAMITHWFDTTRFTVNGIGTFGNSGRNILRGPRLFDTDFAALKNTKMTERLSLQFRAEFFNFFNNVNFGSPNTNISSAQVGRITSAGDPRILQFALKVLF